MKRITISLCVLAVPVFLLAGCATNQGTCSTGCGYLAKTTTTTTQYVPTRTVTYVPTSTYVTTSNVSSSSSNCCNRINCCPSCTRCGSAYFDSGYGYDYGYSNAGWY